MKKKSANSKNKSRPATNLRGLKEELKMKTHLFDADMKDQWNKFEKDWQLVRSEVSRLLPQAKRAVTRSALATKPLMAKIHDSLQRIQEGFQRHHNT